MTQPEVIVFLPETRNQKLEFSWGQLTWFADRAQGNSTDITVGRCILKPHQGNPRHCHPNCSEVLVVLSGRITHTDAHGGETEMGPGDTVTIPANLWHHARNLGDTDAVLLIAFSSADRETVGE